MYALQVDIYIAAYLTELFLVSLWTFSKGTQEIKARSCVKCIQKKKKQIWARGLQAVKKVLAMGEFAVYFHVGSHL